jgi:hypothetical protein
MSGGDSGAQDAQQQQKLLAQQEQERQTKLADLRRQQLVGLRTRFGDGFGSTKGRIALGDIVTQSKLGA